MMRIHTLRRINFMLFDYKFNERLLSFARNIASILLLGGFSLLIMFRADTKLEFSKFESWSLYSLGVLTFLWSMYLAATNVVVLYVDFRDYLLRYLTSNDLESATPKQLKSTRYICKVLMSKSIKEFFLYGCGYLFIGFSFFAFVLIFFLGIIANLNQLAKVFGFVKC